jgi:hypothetical protein
LRPANFINYFKGDIIANFTITKSPSYFTLPEVYYEPTTYADLDIISLPSQSLSVYATISEVDSIDPYFILCVSLQQKSVFGMTYQIEVTLSNDQGLTSSYFINFLNGIIPQNNFAPLFSPALRSPVLRVPINEQYFFMLPEIVDFDSDDRNPTVSMLAIPSILKICYIGKKYKDLGCLVDKES